MSKKWINPLLIILALALLLRLAGIQHSFPVIRHPDEPAVVRAALAMRFNLNPGHFDWPHLYIYMNFFIYKVFALFRDYAAVWGYRTLIIQWIPLFWNDNLIFYLISRILSATIGALTILPVYLSAKNLFNKKIALFSALAMALMPFHVRHSHYALIDVPMTFFLSWALYCSTNIFKRFRTEDYILAGLFVGFAASTKYTGGLSAILVPLAHFLRIYKEKGSYITFEGINSLFLAAAASFFGFILGTPYALLDYKTFSRTDGPTGAFWQFTNVGKVEFHKQIVRFFTSMWEKIASDVGYTFLVGYWIVFLATIKDLIIRKRSPDLIRRLFLAIPSVLFFFYISGFYKNRSHYYMITYPFVAIIAGYFIVMAGEYLKPKLSSLGRFLILLLTLIFFIIPLYFAIMNIIDLTEVVPLRPDSKIVGGDPDL